MNDLEEIGRLREQLTHQTRLAQLAEHAMRSAYEASRQFEALAQRYFDEKEPLEQMRDALIAFAERWNDNDMGGNEVYQRLTAMLALAPKEPT